MPTITDVGNNFLVWDNSTQFYTTSLVLFAVLVVLVNIWFLVPIPLLYKYRHINFIETRGWELLFLQNIFCLVIMNSWLARTRIFGTVALHHPVFATIFGCTSSFYVTYFIYPTIFAIFFTRIAHYIAISSVSERLLRKLDNNATANTATTRFDVFMRRTFQKLFIRNGYAKAYSTSSVTVPHIHIGDSLTRDEQSNMLSEPKDISLSFSTSSMASRNGKVNMQALVLCILIALLLETIACLIAVLPQLPNVPYCDTTHIYTPLHVLLLPAPIIAIACMLAIRNVNDNFGIKTELVSTFIIVFISSTMYYATTLFKFFPIVDTYFGGVPFLFLGGLIFQYFSVISPLYRAYKHTHQVSEPSKIQPKFTIDQALENPTLWAKLQQQIIKDFAGENAEFINDYKHLLRKQQAVDELKRAASLNPNSLSPLSAATSPTLIHDAIGKIIQNYVVPLSPLELNISSATRAFVLEEQKKNNSLSPVVLEPVYREVVRNIESNALPRLFESMKSESHLSLPRC